MIKDVVIRYKNREKLIIIFVYFLKINVNNYIIILSYSRKLIDL